MKTTLETIAEKFRGKELFPDKIKKAKLFFKYLNNTKENNTK